LSELLEKALTTVLTIMMTVSAGVPAVSSGLKFLEENHKLTSINDLIAKVDSGIKQVLLGAKSYTDRCLFPDNLKIRSEGSAIIFEYHALGKLDVKRIEYSVIINVNCPHRFGPCLISISKNNAAIIVDFREE